MNNYFEVDEEDVISIEYFLSNYCCFDFISNNKLSHKELKMFGFPNIICIPFGAVRTNDIKTGNILIVRDFFGHIAPYKNPIRIEESLNKSNKKRVRVEKGDCYD